MRIGGAWALKGALVDAGSREEESRDGEEDFDPERTSPPGLEAPEVECEAAAAARRLPVSDCALAELREVEKDEREAGGAVEALEDLPAAADAAGELDEVVEDVLLEDSDLLHPRRDCGLVAGAGVCLEAEEMEEHRRRRRRKSRRRA